MSDFGAVSKESICAGPLASAEPEIFACNKNYYTNTYQNLIETFVKNRENLTEDQLNYVVSRLFPTYSLKLINLLTENNYRTRQPKFSENRKNFVILFKELHKRIKFDEKILNLLLKDACKRVYENPDMVDEEDNSVSLLFNCGAKFTTDIVKNIVSRWRKHSYNKQEGKISSYNEKLHLYFLSKITKDIYNDLIKNSYNLSFIHNLLVNTNHLPLSMEDFDKFCMAFHIEIMNCESENDKVRTLFCESLTAIEKQIKNEKSESLIFQYFEQYLRKHDFDRGVYYTFFKNIDGTKILEAEAIRASIHIIHNESNWRCIVYSGKINKRFKSFKIESSTKLKMPKENVDVFLLALISVVTNSIKAQESGDINNFEVNSFIKKSLTQELKKQYLVTHL